MATKYGKKILKELEIDIFNEEYHCYILDDKEYYNIHIFNDYFLDEELNTLYLQEPKEIVNLDELDNVYMTERVVEFALWNKFSGRNGSIYNFSISHEIN